MTDDQLIDRTAAAIADDLFRDSGINRRSGESPWLDIINRYGARSGTHNKSDVKCLLARHLAAMLAKNLQTHRGDYDAD